MNTNDLAPNAHPMRPGVKEWLDQLGEGEQIRPSDLATLLFEATGSDQLPDPVFTGVSEEGAVTRRTVWIYNLTHWSTGALLVVQYHLADGVEVTPVADLAQAYREMGEQLASVEVAFPAQ